MLQPSVSWQHVLAFTSTLTIGLAGPLNTHVRHEKRTVSNGIVSWTQHTRVDPAAILPLRIGLVQSNLDQGDFHLDAISNPDSPRYGQHLSAEDVHALFAPADETVEAVRSWLVSSGIPSDDIVHSDNKGWLAVDLPASSIEDLFRTTIHEYKHRSSDALRLGCEEYHVPAHLSEHIDYITPGVKLSAAVKKRDLGASVRRSLAALDSIAQRDIAVSASKRSTIPQDLRNCSHDITPECIRALYNLPTPGKADQANAPGFFEQGDYYATHDLNDFFTVYAPQIANGTGPVQQLIDGAVDPKKYTSPQVAGEADGDLEVAFGLVYPTIPIVYQVDDPYYAKKELAKYNLFNTFLDALDGSYCNYTAYGITGDSWEDPKYPDPHKNGYKGKLQCGVYKPATVISISYGEAEADIPINYDKRQCSEWMKLSLQGHTILTASGDYGVAGFPGDQSANGCINGTDHKAGQPAKVFNPDYLSSCPYITSVGGTVLPLDHTVYEPEKAVLIHFPNDTYPYSSSGGFSNYFCRPKWQDSAVETYFKEHNPGYPSYVANAKVTNVGEGGGLYNRAGRGFP